MGFITKSKSSYSNEVYPDPSINWDPKLDSTGSLYIIEVITWLAY